MKIFSKLLLFALVAGMFLGGSGKEALENDQGKGCQKPHSELLGVDMKPIMITGADSPICHRADAKILNRFAETFASLYAVKRPFSTPSQMVARFENLILSTNASC